MRAFASINLHLAGSCRRVPTVSGIIGTHDAEQSRVMAAIYGLTPREQQVVELVSRGHATRHVAPVSASRRTRQREHLRHIFAKVGVASRGVASRGEIVAAPFFGRG
jgi:DNA-binding CsgD family transcriptional regulator